ncbi:MAG: PTS sugar transporter subunit IIA [Candidatus Omnitrophota bacterium]
MQLTLQDVSKLLNVSERTIYRWIKKKVIPVYKLHNQYRFNKTELLDWAGANKVVISPEMFSDPGEGTVDVAGLAEALRKGGIYYRVGGSDRESVLRNIVDIIHFPEDVDRDFLFKVLLARENLSSTGIGDGIAIPHVRNPIVLDVPYSVISLCFLDSPVDFGALDGKPVHCLFMLVSPTARAHLYLLSRLMFTLKDPELSGVILGHGDRETILREMERVENNIRKA